MRILLFGPIAPPLTGQSKAFGLVCDSIVDKKIVNTTKFNSKFVSTLYTIFQTFILFLIYRFDKVYFTCSRSKLGGIRDIILLLLARIFRVPVVNHLHGFDFYNYSKSLCGIHKQIFYYAYDWVDTSIILHDDMVSEFRDFANMSLETVTNCYDYTLEKSVSIQSGDKLNLLYLSNLMESKGVFVLLEALLQLDSYKDKLRIRIAGDFIDDYISPAHEVKDRFTNKYNQLINLGFDIEYIGIVKGDKKIKILEESDVFVLPTFHKTEAFPISIIEAMRMGNVIITTNHNLLPTIVSNDNGVLVEPGSVDSLANGIKDMYVNKDELDKIKKNNIEEAIQKYSSERYITEVQRIIYK